MSVVVEPSAREAFTPCELTTACKEFLERGPQYLDAETGIRASAYWFGERVLLVYEESQTGLVVLIYPSAWKGNSAKFAFWGFSELGEESCNKYCICMRRCALSGG
jgi:hypothetical protein